MFQENKEEEIILFSNVSQQTLLMQLKLSVLRWEIERKYSLLFIFHLRDVYLKLVTVEKELKWVGHTSNKYCDKIVMKQLDC